MDKLTYYLKVMNTDVYKQRDWVISAFSVLKDRPLLSEVKYPWQIITDVANRDALFVAEPIEGGYQATLIDGSSINAPLFTAKDSVDIVEGSIPLRTGTINTTYGIILGNMYILHYPFGQKFDFINGEIGGKFEDMLSERLVDNLEYGDVPDPNVVYVEEYLRYGEAMGALAGYDLLFASSGSLKAMTVAPEVIKLRNELIEKHKHELHDRTVQAQIEAQLVAADKASFKGDDAEDFLISKKSFNPTRKKALIMIGGSSGFGNEGEATFIAKSLRDKWDIKDIAAHANEARAGSYFRGKETQFGGTDVKLSYRMAMNSKVAMDFCGTTVGKQYTIQESQRKQFLGLFVVTSKGPVELTEETLKSIYGKTVMVYSPQYCKVEGTSYCATCVGKTYSRLKNGIPSAVANIGDVFMYDKMKRMHGKALDTAVLNLKVIAS